jgi:acyl carrier protein
MNINILDRLLDFISNQFCVDAKEIDVNTSLVDQGVIDSIGLIEISGFIEDTYGIQITEKEMTRANFGSLTKIVAFVTAKQGQ